MGSFPFWFIWIFLLITFQRTQTFEGCLCVEEVAKDLQLPVSPVHANDGTDRLFVAEQQGKVHIIRKADGIKLPEPFIDVSSTTGYLGNKSSAGLADIAFHPDYKANGLFYMLVSTKAEGKTVDHYSNLFEYKISAIDSNKADPEYSRLVLKFGQPGWAHNAAMLLFGIDGYLYVFVGDGDYVPGIGVNFSQHMDTFLGKVLRIDVNTRTGDLPYGIPEDNPFNNGSYSKPEIYALGLRNPWRGGIDSGDRKTGEGRGRIIFGDVGQGNVEELDLLEMGANYEWNIMEGTRANCKKSYCMRGPGKFTPPIVSYSRSAEMGKSVIGGQFYRGCRSPKLNGVYLWGDYTSGQIFRLIENKTTGAWDNKLVELCDSCKSPLQSTFKGQIVSFGKDEKGEVYFVSLIGRHPYENNGHIYRFVESAEPGDSETCKVKAPIDKETLDNDDSVNDKTRDGIQSEHTVNEGDYNGNDSDLDKVGNENTSPSETGDEKVAKMSRILDIIKTGNHGMKQTISKLIAKLLARLYYTDFSAHGKQTDQNDREPK